eukprot:CAMPEP_0167766740 /NCGR_PEP_ID=MMETSP0110_2-20121227/15540_1 /TAXON_ID=629695 /ORGANISM="Gymnochlora sp., Strain CCMP2014" /LENGTH=268 /DNA_ID=CAMNT_0007654857 /DNA_START=321 /DNA_END=1124 /DNA_ORIENTATION=-
MILSALIGIYILMFWAYESERFYEDAWCYVGMVIAMSSKLFLFAKKSYKRNFSELDIINCFLDGKGIIEAIERSPESELCTFLPAICLELENMGTSLSRQRKEALEVLLQRIDESCRVAEHVVLMLISHSVRFPSLFKSVRDAAQRKFPKWKISPPEEIKQTTTQQLAYPLHGLFKQSDCGKGFCLQFINKTIHHPFLKATIPLLEASVEKVFQSNAKPLLVSVRPRTLVPTFWSNKDVLQKLILKQGDDLRQDVACMTVFRFLNGLW